MCDVWCVTRISLPGALLIPVIVRWAEAKMWEMHQTGRFVSGIWGDSIHCLWQRKADCGVDFKPVDYRTSAFKEWTTVCLDQSQSEYLLGTSLSKSGHIILLPLSLFCQWKEQSLQSGCVPIIVHWDCGIASKDIDAWKSDFRNFMHLFRKDGP